MLDPYSAVAQVNSQEVPTLDGRRKRKKGELTPVITVFEGKAALGRPTGEGRVEPEPLQTRPAEQKLCGPWEPYLEMRSWM